LAKELVSGNQDPHFEADTFFTRKGAYKFEPGLLSKAHQWCQASVEDRMREVSTWQEDHDDPSWYTGMAVSNTFTRKWEMQPYLDLAEKYGWSVFVIHCQNDFGNVHDVPESVIAKMKQRWEAYP